MSPYTAAAGIIDRSQHQSLQGLGKTIPGRPLMACALFLAGIKKAELLWVRLVDVLPLHFYLKDLCEIDYCIYKGNVFPVHIIVDNRAAHTATVASESFLQESLVIDAEGRCFLGMEGAFNEIQQASELAPCQLRKHELKL